MKRAVTLFLAMAMILSLGICGAYAEDALYAEKGKELVLFDTDGIRLSLTGESEVVSSQLQLGVVMENNTDAVVRLLYTGTVNGWSFGNYVIGGAATNGVQANSKAKGYLWFEKDEVEVGSYEELEKLYLSFQLEDMETYITEEEPIAQCTVYFNGAAPEGGAAAEESAGEAAEKPADASSAEPYSREVTLPGKEYPALGIGSSGDAVKALQQALADQGFLDGAVDGGYGNGTAGAVKAFQESAGLEATGDADSETQRKLFGDGDGETITVTLTGNWDTEHMRMEGLFVDQSAVSKDSEDLVMLYMVYAAIAGDDNISVDAKDTNVVINGKNSYTTGHFAGAGLWFPNYYYSNYLEDVYVGSEQKVVETVWIPKGELAAGRTITLTNTEGEEDISLMTDDVVYCDSQEQIAQIVDPEGYAQQVHALAAADGDTASKARSCMNGYYWQFFVNNLAYKIEFYSGDSFTISVSGLSNTGTYTVRNGYIVLFYPSNSYEVRVPYEFKDGDIKLELADAFDYNEN